MLRYSSELIWNGGRVTAAVARGGAAGVNAALQYLKSRAVPLAPLDQGPLRESATIQPATAERVMVGGGVDSVEGALIFDTPYAARQHEELSYQHTDGQAHYVTDPLEQDRDILLGIQAKQMRQAIANG